MTFNFRFYIIYFQNRFRFGWVCGWNSFPLLDKTLGRNQIIHHIVARLTETDNKRTELIDFPKSNRLFRNGHELKLFPNFANTIIVHFQKFYVRLFVPTIYLLWLFSVFKWSPAPAGFTTNGNLYTINYRSIIWKNGHAVNHPVYTWRVLRQ